MAKKKLKYCALLGFGLLFSSAAAQEWVIDPSFEQFEQLPTHEGQVGYLQHWQPLSPPTGNVFVFPSPDFLHRKGIGLGQAGGHFGKTMPHSGEGMAGLMLWSQKQANFREYLVSPLAQPLVVGATYEVSFWMHTSEYGRFAANGLGVAFVPSLPEAQEGVLPIAPQFSLTEPVLGQNWQRISFRFVAQTPARYWVMGNFLPDSLAVVKPFAQSGNPCSYVLIDDCSLKEALPEQGEEPTDNLENHSLTFLEKLMSEALFGRKVNVTHTITVAKKTIELNIWDAREADRDSISLNFNGKWLLQNHLVTKQPLKISITLEPDQDNYLVLFALNMGSKPPNTAAISFKDGKNKRELVLRSDLQNCGAALLIYQPEQKK